MNVDFQTESKSNHVKFTCQGTYGNEAMFHVYEMALDLATSEGLNCVLIDIRSMGGRTPTTMERYEHGVALARIQSGHGHRILIVVVGSELIIDPKRHCETVAVNRGVYGKAFTDMDLAMEWLDREIEGRKAS